MNKIGVIGAMEVEVKLLKQQIKDPVKTEALGLEFVGGRIANNEVVVVRSGIGKVNAGICAQYLIDNFDVTHIINTGIAGAISRKLAPLDTVISTDALYYDVDLTGFGYPPLALPGLPPTFKADEKLLEISRQIADTMNMKYFCGRIATGDAFVASKEQKKRVRETADPLCVEMEGAAIAHAAFLSKKPFIIIRSISDLADDEGLATYEFNEVKAAQNCAHLVLEMLANI